MSKKLVAYFSASGRTGRVSNVLAEAAGADIYEIKPLLPYTPDDLNWTNSKSRSSVEMEDMTSRPELADQDAPVAEYDVVFLGFPIWWYVAPHIINTFLETYDFTGKTIVLFATSGSSGFGRTLERLEDSVKGSARLMEGKILNGNHCIEELHSWVKSLKI